MRASVASSSVCSLWRRDEPAADLFTLYRCTFWGTHPSAVKYFGLLCCCMSRL